MPLQHLHTYTHLVYTFLDRNATFLKNYLSFLTYENYLSCRRSYNIKIFVLYECSKAVDKAQKKEYNDM